MKKIILVSLALSSLFIAKFAFAGADDLAYFKQFLFQKENVSDDPDFPEYQFRFVMTYYKDMVKLADGRYLNPALYLYMYEDGTFMATYQENYFKSPDSTDFTPGPCAKMTGKWSVPNNQLVLEGIGHADRATENGENALLITYDQDLRSPGLSGHAVKATLGYSNTDEVFCF